MKRILSIILVAAAFIPISSCKKTEVISNVASLKVGSYLTLVQSINTNIDYGNLSTSTVSIKVKEYPGSSPVDIIKLYVKKGGIDANKANWKYIKDVPYSGETTLSVKATEIATALGLATPSLLEPGATYTIYNQIKTKDGGTYDASNTAAGFSGIAAYNMAMTWANVIVCPFVASAAVGTYKIIEDGWDGATGDLVAVTATGSTATVTFLFPYADPPGKNPVNITVNAATGAATVAKQTYGSYGAAFQNFTCETTAAGNWFFSCSGAITLSLKHVSGSGTNYGNYTIRLQKQ